MEPEDTRQQEQFSEKLSKMANSQFISSTSSSESSDNLRSVHKIQTSHRRRKRVVSASTAEEEHQCWSRRCGTLFSFSNSNSSTSSSSSPLVVFLLTSALFLFLCVAPSHSLPLDGQLLSSSSGGGSSSHRSHMDLLIDPIHQAEYGDDDPFENKRIVKSVFDMVLRTPVPPTSSTNRCPPGTQSPFEGSPCIKKSTDPVALVDSSFLLESLRGLAKEGALLGGGPQRTRRPGGNRRRPSGRPGSRTPPTTSSTTTASPPTTMTSTLEDEDDSPTTNIISATTGDNNVNLVEEMEEVVMSITQEPSPTPSSVGETTLPSEDTVRDEETTTTIKSEEPTAEQSVISSGIPTTTSAPEESSSIITTTTTAAPTPIVDSDKNGVNLRRPTEPEIAVPSSSSSTGNDELIAAEATSTTPTTTLKTVEPSQALETTITIPVTVGTAQMQQVKSVQVHKAENDAQVPTSMMMSQTTISSPLHQEQQSGANNIANPVHLDDNTHNLNQNNNMDSSQISLESHTAGIEQDDHHRNQQTQPIPPLMTTTITPSSLSSPITSTQPTFPKQGFLTVDVTIHQYDDHDQQDIILSSTISPAVTATATSLPMTTTPATDPVNPIGAENHVVTGVIIPSEQPLSHQPQEEIHNLANAQSFHDDHGVKIEGISVAKHPETQISQTVVREAEESVGEAKMKMMTTRMIQAPAETPQDFQQGIQQDPDNLQTDKDDMRSLQQIPSALPADSNLRILLTSTSEPSPVETRPSLTPVSEEEPVKDGPILTDASQNESGMPHSIAEKSNATIPSEKVPVPLGPLDTQTETIVAQVPEKQQVQEQEHYDSNEKAEAGDMSMTRKLAAVTEEQVEKGVNEANKEQGDDQPSSTSTVVNHLTGDGDLDDDKGKETVQMDNTDLPIINGNLPSSVSPVQVNHQEQIRIIEDFVNNNKDTEGEIRSSMETGSREQEYSAYDSEGARDLPPISVEKGLHVPDATLSPPSLLPITGIPGSPLRINKFQPTDTLLQFQLPIVTSVPTASYNKHTENGIGGGADEFQKFPEFPTFTNTGKVRFPNSAEIDEPAEEGPTSDKIQGTLKPVFVQDFHVAYHSQKHAEPPPQDWQVPHPFQLPESSNAPQQQETRAPIILPEYYDTGSTEYLESELDRRHQKSRSRNRIRNSPEPATTTNSPPLFPPELSFYSPSPSVPTRHQEPPPPPQHQEPPPPPQNQEPPPSPQQHHAHHQPSVYFARRNPSSDLIPFGYLNFRTGHDRLHHNNRRLVW